MHRSAARSPVGFTVLAAFALALGSSAAPAQEAALPLEAAQVVGTVNQQFRGAGDFDGDGDVDLLSGWAQELVQLMNDGTGQFTAAAPLNLSGLIAPPQSIGPLLVRDLNADGRADIVASYGHLVGGLVCAAGNGAPVLTWWIEETATVTKLEVGDYDGDGLLDVALVTTTYFSGGSASTLRFWRGTPSGAHVLTAAVPITNASLGVHLRTTDTNGDGVDELFVVTHAPGPCLLPPPPWNCPAGALTTVTTLTSYSGAGGQLTTTTMQLTEATPMAPAPAFGDVDGDQDVDVVLFYSGATLGAPAVYRVLRAGPGGGFVAEPTAAGGPATDLGDFDGDGDLDGICCGGGGTPANQAASRFEVALNDGTGAFAPAFAFPGKGSAGIVGALDLDGDGDRELIAGVCVFWNRGTLPTAASPHVLPGAFLPLARHIVDLDGDGDLDFMHGFGAGAALNDGSGAFTYVAMPAPPTAPGTAVAGSSPVLCDVDGDGARDALCPLQSSPGGADLGTRLLKNRGDGVFVDGGFAIGAGQSVSSWTFAGGQTVYFANFGADATVAADLDGDGDEDLLAFGQLSNPPVGVVFLAATWMNDGAGQFTPGSALPNFVVHNVGDLTGDGLPDLAGLYMPTGSLGNPSFAIARNVAGTFAPPGPADLYPGPPAVYGSPVALLRDLDGDGDRDFVQTDGVAYLNDGAGSLTPGPVLPGYIVNVLDMDGDALPEVVVGTGGGPNFEVWRRTSTTSSFARSAAFVLPASNTAFRVLADWDGDGDEDCTMNYDVLANAGLTFRNVRYHGPTSGSRKQFGAGVAGLGGQTPLLGVAGPLRPGLVADFRITGGLGGTVGFLSFGVVPAAVPFLGGTHYLEPVLSVPLTLTGAPGTPGTGTASVPVLLPPGFSGVPFIAQAAFFDPAAPVGVSWTQGLVVVIGV